MHSLSRGRFSHVPFVRGKGTLQSVHSPPRRVSDEPRESVSGVDVREFYESVISTPSSAVTIPPPKVPRQKRVKPAQRIPNSCESFVRVSRLTKRFLLSAQQGDMDCLEECLSQGVDVNCQDEFQWTALMCAVQARQVGACKLLLDRGASTSMRESTGMNALDLAERKNTRILIGLLRSYMQKDASDEETPRSSVGCVVPKPFYCDSCQTRISDSLPSEHETSVAHLLSQNRGPPPAPSFMIPRSNPGFQLMVKGGWDEASGLGSNQQGRKYPVQTVLKRDRLGVGHRNEKKPRVTHFKPFDPSAVTGLHRHERQATLTRKQHEKRLDRERKWEINFRRYFDQ